jgi:hypothetical protein
MKQRQRSALATKQYRRNGEGREARLKPQARPTQWDIYRAAAKARLIGAVEAPDADAASNVAAGASVHGAIARQRQKKAPRR